MLKLIASYFYIYTKAQLKNVSNLFFTLIFPSMLYLMFATSSADLPLIVQLAVYANFAMQSVMMQGYGMTLAAEKNSPWVVYVKTLPVSEFAIILGRIFANLVFAVLSISFLILVASLRNPIAMNATQLGTIYLIAIIGGIPLGLFATLVVKLLNPQAARAALILSNTFLLFTVLANANKSFDWLITIEWMRLATAALFNQPFTSPLLGMLAYSVILACCVCLFQKDSHQII